MDDGELRSKIFVICARVGDSEHKLFQVHFAQSDGSIFVGIPYFPPTPGLLAEFTIPADTPSAQVELGKIARITSYPPKLSHHPDGQVHFSQDGFIQTIVKRRSVPLCKLDGHLFTVCVVGPEHFTAERPKDLNAKATQRRHLSIGTVRGRPIELKFVASWFTLRRLTERNPQTALDKLKARQHGVDHNGRGITQLLLMPPDHHPFRDHVLQIDCSPATFGDATSPSLSLIGGFDPPHLVGDLTNPTSGLICQYPASNIDELRSTLQTVDLDKR